MIIVFKIHNDLLKTWVNTQKLFCLQTDDDENYDNVSHSIIEPQYFCGCIKLDIVFLVE